MEHQRNSPFQQITKALYTLVDQEDKEQFLIKIAEAVSTLQSLEKKVALLERINISIEDLVELEQSLKERDDQLESSCRRMNELIKN